MTEPRSDLCWYPCRLVSGHGVASGDANRDPLLADSPYPEGTIAMQAPLFAERGLDLSPYWPGTLNVSFAPRTVALYNPDFYFPHLLWTSLHPPETFSFWRVVLRRIRSCQDVNGLLYFPHPETKKRHWQPQSVVEVLAPWLNDLDPQEPLSLGVGQSQLSLLDGSPTP